MHVCTHKDTQVLLAETNWMLLIVASYHAIYNLFRQWRHLLYCAQYCAQIQIMLRLILQGVSRVLRFKEST